MNFVLFPNMIIKDGKDMDLYYKEHGNSLMLASLSIVRRSILFAGVEGKPITIRLCTPEERDQVVKLTRQD